MPAPIRTIKFWLNAFIPRDVPGATTTLRRGPYAGLTAVAGSLCCLTDQRSFSNNLHAKSRMHSEVIVDFTGPSPTMAQRHKCDYTIECDCESGEIQHQKQASTSHMKFVCVSIEPSTVIRMDCTSSNPCAPSSQAFGDIDYKGTIIIDHEARSIAIDLMIGLFPAFEAYAAINDGPGAILFRQAPPAGYTMMRFPAGPNRLIRSSLQDRDGDGIFELPRV